MRIFKTYFILNFIAIGLLTVISYQESAVSAVPSLGERSVHHPMLKYLRIHAL